MERSDQNEAVLMFAFHLKAVLICYFSAPYRFYNIISYTIEQFYVIADATHTNKIIVFM